jgi:acyl-ACP thioesterase
MSASRVRLWDHARRRAVNRLTAEITHEYSHAVPATPDDEALTPRPAAGRVFQAGRRPVRFADVHPSGRMRLDGIARHLQDLSADDTVDAALEDGGAWVVRRTVVEVDAFPRYLEVLTPVTWCSGTGSHYAERRAEIRGERGGQIDAASLWVQVERDSGRPRRVTPQFTELYGAAAGGRQITARLVHDAPPPDLDLRDWVVRASDFDMWRHVNNSVYWAIVEEAWASIDDLAAPLRAELEHRDAISPGASVQWGWVPSPGGGFDLWILADGAVVASAQVRPR